MEKEEEKEKRWRCRRKKRRGRRLLLLLQLDPVNSSAGDLVSVIRALKEDGISSQMKIRWDTCEAALDLPFSPFRQKAAANEVGQPQRSTSAA